MSTKIKKMKEKKKRRNSPLPPSQFPATSQLLFYENVNKVEIKGQLPVRKLPFVFKT